MKRICVVTQDPRFPGGVRTKLEAFLRMAEAWGFECDLYFPLEGGGDSSGTYGLEEFAATRRILGTGISGFTPHFLRAIEFAWKSRIPTDYDGYQLVGGALYQGLALARGGHPFLAWIAGTHRADVEATSRERLRHFVLYNPITNHLTKRLELESKKTVVKVLPVSRNSARELKKELSLPPERVKVMPIPVDMERFNPGQPTTSPRPYVLSVARLDRRKDFPTLLRAFKRVVEEFGEVELRIIGTGKEKERLESLAVDLDLSAHVRFLGYVDTLELQTQYREATLFVLTSRQEGLGIVFLEAMASGLPVVATDSGGSADAVHAGETGYLVPVGAPGALADRILKLLSTPTLARRMGMKGRRRVESHFSFEAIGREFRQTYAEAFSI